MKKIILAAALVIAGPATASFSTNCYDRYPICFACDDRCGLDYHWFQDRDHRGDCWDDAVVAPRAHRRGR
jgi:hypothetical protein